MLHQCPTCNIVFLSCSNCNSCNLGFILAATSGLYTCEICKAVGSMSFNVNDGITPMRCDTCNNKDKDQDNHQHSDNAAAVVTATDSKEEKYSKETFVLKEEEEDLGPLNIKKLPQSSGKSWLDTITTNCCSLCMDFMNSDDDASISMTTTTRKQRCPTRSSSSSSSHKGEKDN